MFDLESVADKMAMLKSHKVKVCFGCNMIAGVVLLFFFSIISYCTLCLDRYNEYRTVCPVGTVYEYNSNISLNKSYHSSSLLIISGQ